MEQLDYTIDSIKKEINKIEYLYENNKFDEILAISEPLLEKILGIIKEIEVIDPKKLDFNSLQRNNNNKIILNTYRDRLNILLYESKKESQRNMQYFSLTKLIQNKEINKIMYKNQTAINDLIYKSRSITEDDKNLKILRRWNSYTPLLNFQPTENLGGGYFFVWKNTGVIIDPGINFLQNDLKNSISISDIDAIILTHSHVDHTSDFEGIMTLFHIYNELRYDTSELEPKKILLYITIGSMNKYSNMISLSYDNISEIIVINPYKTYEISETLYFKPTKCIHEDLYCKHQHSCVGLIFYDKSTNKPIFGLSSDTSYSKDIKDCFEDISDIPLVLHIGGIKEEEYDISQSAKKIVYETHLGLKGLYNFIFDLKPKIVIISEFGEEFKDTRVELIKTYKEIFPETKFIPADLNLSIHFCEKDPKVYVYCESCGKKINIEDISYRLNEENSSIEYICADCE